MNTIVFDLDDVLVKDAFFGILKEFVSTRYKRTITEEDVGTEYYYEKPIFGNDQEMIKEFHEYFLEHNMYDYGVLEDGAIELLKELSKTHNVVIYTSSILESVENAAASAILFKNKFEFLCKTFPFIPPSNFILGRNKSIIFSDYMVDDRVDNLTGNIRVKMLYSARHNLDISDKALYDKGIFRVSSMEELRKVVYGDFTTSEIFKIINEVFSYSIYLECDEVSMQLSNTSEATLNIEFSGMINYREEEKVKKFLHTRLGMTVNMIRKSCKNSK